MRNRRPSEAVVAFVVLTTLQPVLLVLVGALHHPNTRGVCVIAVLVAALACRSRIAWVLLVVIDAIPLLAVLGLVGGHVLWSHLVVMVLTGVLLEAVLLSEPMRRYVDRGAGRAGAAEPPMAAGA